MLPECISAESMRTRLAQSKYVIHKLIGTGAMACVYLAQERDTPDYYALKVLRDEYYSKEIYRRMFQYEAETMQRFQHRHIVRFYQYQEEANTAFIRMDYIEGDSLQTLLRRARQQNTLFTPDDVVRIMYQAARALSYLHEAHQLHLDMKPGNILIRRHDGHVFVTDLGLTLDKSSQRTTRGGTPYYMPYEQQIGGEIGTYTDSYALAVIIYEMLALRRPFEVPTEMEQDELRGRELLRQMHQSAFPDSLRQFRPDLPHEVDTVLQKALHKSPDQRYDVLALAKALHRALSPVLSPEIRQLEMAQPRTLTMPAVSIKSMQTPNTVSVPLTPSAQTTPAMRRWGRLVALLMVGLIVSVGLGTAWMQLGAYPVTPTSNLIEDKTKVADLILQTQQATAANQEIPGPQSALIASKTVIEAVSSPTEKAASTLADGSVTIALSETITPSLTPTILIPATEISSPDTTVTRAVQDSYSITATQSPTVAATRTATNTPTPSETPTSTPTLTATATPTTTSSPTPTPTLTPVPTTFLSSDPYLTIIEGEKALAMDMSLAESLPALVLQEQPLIPLRLGIVNGFRVEIGFADVDPWAEYGVAFRINEKDYALFAINSDARAWSLFHVKGNDREMLMNGDLTNLPNHLIISGRDNFFRFELSFDDETPTILQYEFEAPTTGQSALWLIPNSDDPAQISEAADTVDEIRLGLVGRDAVLAATQAPTSIPDIIRKVDFLKTELEIWLTTGDNRGRVDCDKFTEQYHTVESYLTHPGTESDAKQALVIGDFIYSACLSTGEITLNMADTFTDYLSWQTSLQSLIKTMSG